MLSLCSITVHQADHLTNTPGWITVDRNEDINASTLVAKLKAAGVDATKGLRARSSKKDSDKLHIYAHGTSKQNKKCELYTDGQRGDWGGSRRDRLGNYLSQHLIAGDRLETEYGPALCRSHWRNMSIDGISDALQLSDLKGNIAQVLANASSTFPMLDNYGRGAAYFQYNNQQYAVWINRYGATSIQLVSNFDGKDDLNKLAVAPNNQGHNDTALTIYWENDSTNTILKNETSQALLQILRYSNSCSDIKFKIKASSSSNPINVDMSAGHDRKTEITNSNPDLLDVGDQKEHDNTGMGQTLIKQHLYPLIQRSILTEQDYNALIQYMIDNGYTNDEHLMEDLEDLKDNGSMLFEHATEELNINTQIATQALHETFIRMSNKPSLSENQTKQCNQLIEALHADNEAFKLALPPVIDMYYNNESERRLLYEGGAYSPNQWINKTSTLYDAKLTACGKFIYLLYKACGASLDVMRDRFPTVMLHGIESHFSENDHHIFIHMYPTSRQSLSINHEAPKNCHLLAYRYCIAKDGGKIQAYAIYFRLNNHNSKNNLVTFDKNYLLLLNTLRRESFQSLNDAYGDSFTLNNGYGELDISHDEYKFVSSYDVRSLLYLTQKDKKTQLALAKAKIDIATSLVSFLMYVQGGNQTVTTKALSIEPHQLSWQCSFGYALQSHEKRSALMVATVPSAAMPSIDRTYLIQIIREGNNSVTINRKLLKDVRSGGLTNISSCQIIRQHDGSSKITFLQRKGWANGSKFVIYLDNDATNSIRLDQNAAVITIAPDNKTIDVRLHEEYISKKTEFENVSARQMVKQFLQASEADNELLETVKLMREQKSLGISVSRLSINTQTGDVKAFAHKSASKHTDELYELKDNNIRLRSSTTSYNAAKYDLTALLGNDKKAKMVVAHIAQHARNIVAGVTTHLQLPTSESPYVHQARIVGVDGSEKQLQIASNSLSNQQAVEFVDIGISIDKEIETLLADQ